MYTYDAMLFLTVEGVVCLCTSDFFSMVGKYFIIIATTRKGLFHTHTHIEKCVEMFSLHEFRICGFDKISFPIL